MLSRLIQNPLTRKRLRRFRARRRAYASLWILGVAYLLSLGAELLCNDRPLAVRFDDRWYFPVFRFHPEDTFTGSGRLTRPDYRALAAAPEFRANPRNRMIFPLIPYGPNESIDPASIQPDTAVTVTLTPVPRVGNVNIDARGRVQRALAAGPFFATNDAAVAGQNLSDHFVLPPPLAAAIAARLRNAPAPAFAATLTPIRPGLPAADVNLPAYTPRDAPPATVRLTLREAAAPAAPFALAFTTNATPVATSEHPTPRPPPPDLAPFLDSLAPAIRQAATAYVAPLAVELDGRPYTADIRKHTVAWPHPPVPGHPLGIDESGRDVLARLIYGFRISMTFGFLLVTVTMVLGIAFGAVQGYFGGKLDLLGQRATEIWSALPFLYVMILLGAVYGRSFVLLLACYGIFNWIGISYYVRAEFLRLRRQPYVEAARCLGVPAWRIILQHLLPNALTPVITFLPFSLVGAIMALYSLDYLGFGLPPPTPSWGELLYQAQQYRWAWWLTFYPAAAIFVVMLLGVFVGEGLRDAFDPKPLLRLE